MRTSCKAMKPRSQIDVFEEIIVDSFAGGGGASTGIELATGRVVDVAINHDPDAILMHRTNHPYTVHYQASVWDVDPAEVCAGRPVGLLWASPDCKHFRKGKPVKSKAGETFHRWVEQLQSLGYEVEWRELVAADYGAPTTRKRFFLIARRDGCPIVWPEPTHAPVSSLEVKAGVKKPWRSAAEIINWGLPTPSIFASKKEIWEQYGISAVRPLARNTMRRVARGVDKFVIRSAAPFLVSVNHSGDFRGQAIDKPLQTITAKHGYGITYPMMSPFTATNTTNSVGAPGDQPLHTVTTAGNQLLILPALAAIGQTGGGDRGRSITEPAHTQVSKAEECVICPAMVQYHTERSDYVRAQRAQDPLMTVDAANRHGLTSVCMVKYDGSAQHGQEAAEPLHTITERDREGLTAVSLAKYFGSIVGTEMSSPLPTVTAVDHNALQAVRFAKVNGDCPGEPLRESTGPDTGNCLRTGRGGSGFEELAQNPSAPERVLRL